ncbi:MAG: hypothetical protein QOD75_2732 [Blastocatellia bacterium]|jgi:hypothetical protein|nr:hypothetical protein [Blastocatellia bacterium]
MVLAMQAKTLRLFVAFLAALLCFPLLVNGQHRPSKNSLVLTTAIVSREQLGNNTLEMRLQLRFRNTGHRRLILHRPSLLLAETGIFEDVEHPTNDTFAEVSEMDYVPHPGSSFRFHEWVRARPGKDFMILMPGHAYTMYQLITARIPTRKSSDGARFLLTVKFNTWFGSKDLATQLNRRWRRFGTLWSDSVASEPMPFLLLTMLPNKSLDAAAGACFVT